MPHSLFIIKEAATGTRVGSIQAVSAKSALARFIGAVPVDRRKGLTAVKAQDGERA